MSEYTFTKAQALEAAKVLIDKKLAAASYETRMAAQLLDVNSMVETTLKSSLTDGKSYTADALAALANASLADYRITVNSQEINATGKGTIVPAVAIKSAVPVEVAKPTEAPKPAADSSGSGGGAASGETDSAKAGQRVIAAEQQAAAGEGPGGLFGMFVQFLAMVFSGVGAMGGYGKRLHNASVEAVEQRGPLAGDATGIMAGSTNTMGGIATYLYTAMGMMLTGQVPNTREEPQAQLMEKPRERVIVDTNLRSVRNPELDDFLRRPGMASEENLSTADLGALPRQSTPDNRQPQQAQGEGMAQLPPRR